jgi:hypothetical protein
MRIVISKKEPINIEVRYEDYRQDFNKKCTKEFCERQIQRITELREWLKEIIKL